MKDVIRETLAFKDLTPEEKEKRGILGRLYGPCADIKAPTRNDRYYSDKLWENVFEHNEIVKELLANGGIPGEAQHPTDRTEIDAEKIAIMMPEAPKKDDKGHLIAYFDILDTPCGRIVYQLAKYGFKLGVSSRGTGDVYDDGDEEVVDPETYDFSCFDTVIIPAVKDARMNMTEGLDKNMINFKKAINESLEKETPGNKKIMEETLNDLNIDYDHEDGDNIENDESTSSNETDETNSNEISALTVENVIETLKGFDKDLPVIVENITIDGKEYSLNLEVNSDKDKVSVIATCNPIESELEPSEINDKPEEADNDGADEIIKDLQEAIKNKSELESSVKSLQEQLAVSDTKVNELNEELSRYKSTVVRLTTISRKTKGLSKQVSELEESLKSKEQEIKVLTHKNSRLSEMKKLHESKGNFLQENLKEKDTKISTLKEELTKQKTLSEDKIKLLNEQIEKEQKETSIKIEGLTRKITKAKHISEGYKKLANDTMSKYIESKALMLGISVNEIKNKLGESYTLDDVDSICEDIQSYSLNMSKLPFKIDKKVKVRINESKPSILPKQQLVDDDDIDISLLKMAGIDVIDD